MTSQLPPLRGEIMPKETVGITRAPSAPPPQVGGPKFWVKWRYHTAREKAEAYTQFLRSLTDTVTATEQLDRAIERRDIGLMRLERLDVLRKAEGNKIDAEVEGVRDRLESQRFTNRAALADLESTALAAERRRDRMKIETSAEEKPDVSPARRAADLIKSLRAEQAEIIKEMKDGADGSWTDLDGDTVHRMELALNDRINRIIEEMRDA